MILIDDAGRKYEMKCPDCPKRSWSWWEVWGGVMFALVAASQLFA